MANGVQSRRLVTSVFYRWKLTKAEQKGALLDDYILGVIRLQLGRADVIDKTYHVNKKARGTVEIVDDAYCVSVPSAVKLLVLQSQHQHKTKEDSEKPNVLEVVICRRHMNYEVLQALQLGIWRFSEQYVWVCQKGSSHLWISIIHKVRRFNILHGILQVLPQAQLITSSGKIIVLQYSGKFCNFVSIKIEQEKLIYPIFLRHLQELGNIDYADCMLSVCGHKTLREVSSPGKSGSLLFRSMDDRFVIKTLRQAEVKVLIEMLPNYLHHVKYGSSLLVKFYGLHSVRPVGGLKVYFVVMENVLQSDLFLHRRSDLKGSSQG